VGYLPNACPFKTPTGVEHPVGAPDATVRLAWQQLSVRNGMLTLGVDFDACMAAADAIQFVRVSDARLAPNGTPEFLAPAFHTNNLKPTVCLVNEETFDSPTCVDGVTDIGPMAAAAPTDVQRFFTVVLNSAGDSDLLDVTVDGEDIYQERCMNDVWLEGPYLRTESNTLYIVRQAGGAPHTTLARRAVADCPPGQGSPPEVTTTILAVAGLAPAPRTATEELVVTTSRGDIYVTSFDMETSALVVEQVAHFPGLVLGAATVECLVDDDGTSVPMVVFVDTSVRGTSEDVNGRIMQWPLRHADGALATMCR
jgi:hypothetical protein